MINNLVSFIKCIYKNLRLNAILIVSLFIFGFLYFLEKVDAFIYKNLLVSETFHYPLLDWSLLIVSCIVILRNFKDIFIEKKTFRRSDVFLSLNVVFFLTFYFFHDTDFKFLKTSFSLPYICLIYFPSLSFLIFALIKRICFPNTTESEARTIYSDDHPIQKIEDDLLEYKDLVLKIKNILLNSKHKSAFAVGLVGSWGTGKSSIINMVRNQITREHSDLFKFKNYFKARSEYPIIINFLPYLNHREEDIISEFFTELSSKLSQFDVNLSNIILDYSEKITNLYKEKSIKDFLKSSVNNQQTPTSKLYLEINQTLRVLDKKIIVFVDDLDRLNEIEILQVLKLIRNTADFFNTIFVVAMDKDYVINRLKVNDKILDARYVDKFFQLEIYLPEIDAVTIREIFKNKILESSLSSLAKFNIELDEALNNEYNLFDYYVKNLRDVNRVINQLSFDYPFFADEIDLKDLMNFIYFKLKFPKAIRMLRENSGDFLKINSKTGQYLLEKKKASSDKRTELNYLLDNIVSVRKKKIDITHYIATEKENSLPKFSDIDENELELFYSTLVCLFGDVNTVQNSKSIKFESNFRKLMQQKYLATDLKEIEFELLLEENEADRLADGLLNLYASKKIDQLINRFEFFNTDVESKLKRAILILALIFDMNEVFSANEARVLYLLNTLCGKYEDKGDLKKWLNDSMITKLSKQGQILILVDLYFSNETNKIGFEENIIGEKVVELFQKYLDEIKDNEISYDDYKLFKLFHKTKSIGDIKSNIVAILKQFWRFNISVLCCQLTDLGYYSVETFRISNVADEIFGSKKAFIEFVEDNNPGTPEVNDFLRLYELLTIVNFQGELLFKFERSSKMKEKVRSFMERSEGKRFDDMNDVCQIFFETNNKTLFERILDDDSNRHRHALAMFNHKGLYYMKANLNKNSYRNEISKFVILFIEGQSVQNNFTESNLEEMLKFKKFDFDNNNYVRIKSIQR